MSATTKEPIGKREFYEKYFSAELIEGFPASIKEPQATLLMTGVSILYQLERIADTLEEMLRHQRTEIR